MSLDRSLKGKSTLERHRNVLRRSERIVMLEDNEKWSESKNSVFSLVKVAHRKQVAAKKAPKAEVAVAADGTTPVAGGAATAAPAGGKAPASPAAGAKGAPAAKAAAKK